MGKFDSIIFDLDGTLWDATEASAVGWNNALTIHGLSRYQVTSDDIRKICGLPFDECLTEIFGGHIEVNCDVISPLIDDEEKKAIEEIGGTLYGNVIEGLEALSRQYKLFLISNCQSWYLDLFLNNYNVRNFFCDSDCYGHSNVSKAEMIKNMVSRHNLLQAIYIGDTEGDMNSSSKAHVAFGYAAYGFGSIDNCGVSFGSFSQLTRYFKTR